jgi:hypothetical protein
VDARDRFFKIKKVGAPSTAKKTMYDKRFGYVILYFIFRSLPTVLGKVGYSKVVVCIQVPAEGTLF